MDDDMALRCAIEVYGRREEILNKVEGGSKVRADVQEDLMAYATEGRPLGGFLLSVVSNDLAQSIVTADKYNLSTLRDIVGFIERYLPRVCWGSRAIVGQWVRAHCTRRARMYIGEIQDEKSV